MCTLRMEDRRDFRGLSSGRKLGVAGMQFIDRAYVI